MRPGKPGFKTDWATVLGSTSPGLAFFVCHFRILLPVTRVKRTAGESGLSPTLKLTVGRKKMKLKQTPEDFQVEELTDVVPTGEGPFALDRMEKRGWATPDALAAVRRRWKIQPNRLSYGGLKDRHALTVQYLTIFRGPSRKLTHHDIHLEYLGQV